MEFTLSTLGDTLCRIHSLVHYRSNTWIDVQFLIIKNWQKTYLDYVTNNLHTAFSIGFGATLEEECVRFHVKEVGNSKKQNAPNKWLVVNIFKNKRIVIK